MTAQLLLGTRNTGKAGELRALLRGLELELVSVADLADPPLDPPEDAPTYAENDSVSCCSTRPNPRNSRSGPSK